MEQKQVADLCNIAESVYSSYERGERGISAERAMIIAKALDGKVEDFFTTKIYKILEEEEY